MIQSSCHYHKNTNITIWRLMFMKTVTAAYIFISDHSLTIGNTIENYSNCEIICGLNM